MKQILSDKDKNTLDIFSLYLQSYGSKIGKYSIDISTDGEVYWDYPYWSGDSTRMSIDSFDAIDELIKRIFDENEDTMLENFGSDDRGSVKAIVNCNDRTLRFKADVLVMDVEHSSQEYSFDEIDDDRIKIWLDEMKRSHVSGEIEYQGGGDSGYIESDIIFNDNSRADYPAAVEDWMYNKLRQFGGWEINEGSQGQFHFNFSQKTIILNHGSNYESESIFKIPLLFEF